jgi:hypothetical protein
VGASLVMVVEVDWDDRIRCQAPGCGKPVYKRIHVVRDSDPVIVVGSECWARFYAGIPGTSSKPQHGTTQGHKLTAQERAQLLANTAAFIARIEQEALAAAAIADAERAKRESARPPQPRRQPPPFDPDDPPYVAPEEHGQRPSPREALQKWREHEALRIARELLAHSPAFQSFPERWIARAMLRAREDLVASGVKLDEPGSRQRIEAGALALLQRHYPGQGRPSAA